MVSNKPEENTLQLKIVVFLLLSHVLLEFQLIECISSCFFNMGKIGSFQIFIGISFRTFLEQNKKIIFLAYSALYLGTTYLSICKKSIAKISLETPVTATRNGKIRNFRCLFIPFNKRKVNIHHQALLGKTFNRAQTHKVRHVEHQNS